MRTFIALKLPGDFRSDVAALAHQLQGSTRGKFVQPDNYHVTLAFLGDASRQDVEFAVGALESACAGVRPIQLASAGLGKFGKSHNATLWLGLTASEQLTRLALSVREELAARGVPFDSKAFKPHLTLARHAELPSGALPPLPFPADCEASEVVLYKSELSQEGASYTPLHVVQLGDGVGSAHA